MLALYFSPCAVPSDMVPEEAVRTRVPEHALVPSPDMNGATENVASKPVRWFQVLELNSTTIA